MLEITHQQLRQVMAGVRATASRRQRGFTLVELMVTVAIAAVAMMVGIPSFVQFIRNAKLSDATGNFMSASNAARAQAMKTGVNTFLVPNVSADGWKSGWMVYTDKNWNAAYDAGTDEVVMRHDAISTDITITTTVLPGSANTLVDGYLLFNGSGFPRMTNGGFANGRATFTTVDRASTVIFDQTGRVRTCTTGSTGC